MATAKKPYSLADAGWKDDMPNKLHLLPLLQPPKDAYNALYAPIHLWPDEWQLKAEVAFNAKENSKENFYQQNWMATKHVFPAAYPRSHPQSVFTPGKEFEPKMNFNVDLTPAELKQKRKDDIKKGLSIIQQVDLEPFVPAKSEQEANERAKVLAQSGQPQLWGCVERIASFRERPKGKPITIVLAHATGFHKEIFRPSVQSLIKSFETQNTYFIDEIWSLDNFRTGDAGLLNAPFVGPAISSHDIARDIQQFIQFYLPIRSASEDKDGFDNYPLHLKRQECGRAREDRTIIAIGHSQGAATLLMAINAVAKANQPKTQLVDGFVAFDATFPIRESLLLQPLPHNESNVALTLVRKDVFIDKNDLMEYLNKVPMFKTFDDRVKKLYADYGFKQVKVANKGGEESKKTFLIPKISKWAEALSFCQLWLNCWTSTEVQARNYNGWTHFMVSTFIRDFPDKIVAEVYTFCEQVAKTNSPSITFQYVEKGHLYPLEDPHGFGRDVAKVLHEKLLGSEHEPVTKPTGIEKVIGYVRSRL
ncbi:uncharacterized protein FA14DRAFT_174325 [Meira miltonrushii]|uniref:Uncharacterized protein n=1 Tax=Meira miltonrushii TaxID=1280837 RepID=A0A316V5W0_9BASI|nr:uncharacterized protein FA14DRAFT_174325 [Meira miltonrushii]PWN32624.1 hypothetical protein FA14DRAFT_174325 [Meira miltonrushii]